jgi:hypothetical protein
MKYIVSSCLVALALVISACGENSSKKPYIMGSQQGVNTNSIAFKAKDNALNRENKIELAKIQASTKLEVAKIESTKAVNIAQIQSQTTQVVSQMDKQTKEKQSDNNLYIAIGGIMVILVGIILWYRHKRKSLEVEVKLEENRLKHEIELKDKELKEQRIHKVFELAMSGQLPPEVQQEVLHSLTRPESKLIESK